MKLPVVQDCQITWRKTSAVVSRMNVGPMLKQKGFDDYKPEKKLVAET
jgi:hypothetical protein